MEEKKVLTTDTMICDLRTVSEETLQSYEKNLYFRNDSVHYGKDTGAFPSLSG